MSTENLHIDKNIAISLSTATGQKMHVAGTTTLTAKANGVECCITAIVSKDLQEDLLISCNDLKTLKVIPRGFPTEICNAVDHRDVQTDIINTYTDVISDELNPIPMQTGGNMHISLVDKIEIIYHKPLKYLLNMLSYSPQ